MIVIYNFIIGLYFFAIRIASLWNKKAAAWVNDRKGLFTKLENELGENDRIIWMHCASAGEFEQGKPLLEALKKNYPAHKLLVSFFSPSGYTTATRYLYADYISYLPLDTLKNAEHFVGMVKPELIIFVKYEFWYHHLKAATTRGIPLLLVSAVFREQQVFFKSYGGFFRRILFRYHHIFVQDDASLKLLQKNKITTASISGDTRFDRVKNVADRFTEVPFIKNFTGTKNTIVAGSTWPGDEALLAAFAGKNLQAKLIIAPHEINAVRLTDLVRRFPNAVLYSAVLPEENGTVTTEPDQHNTTALAPENVQVLIIDSIGLLSRLYSYATIAYIGGGFTRDGIHNTLEAAVWNKPVIFGPNYKKYREADGLLKAGGGFSIGGADEFNGLVHALFSDQNYLKKTGRKAGDYILQSTGATDKVMCYIQENRLLTSP